MKIEKEIRFYFPENKLTELAKLLKSLYAYDYSYHEVTTMYDNPNPDLTFYSKEIDGRLRTRYSKLLESKIFGQTTGTKDAPESQCLVTWKRRLAGGLEGSIRREEEIEYSTPSDDFNSVTAIFEHVLGCKRVSSYERIRNFLSTDRVQVTCDEFPYGIMLELELKGDNLDEKDLFDEVLRLGLDADNASNLSCDDMYFKLCEENGLTPLADITFDDTSMPKIPTYSLN